VSLLAILVVSFVYDSWGTRKKWLDSSIKLLLSHAFLQQSLNDSTLSTSQRQAQEKLKAFLNGPYYEKFLNET
jgi:hypothetical protein